MIQPLKIPYGYQATHEDKKLNAVAPSLHSTKGPDGEEAQESCTLASGDVGIRLRRFTGDGIYSRHRGRRDGDRFAFSMCGGAVDFVARKRYLDCCSPAKERRSLTAFCSPSSCNCFDNRRDWENYYVKVWGSTTTDIAISMDQFLVVTGV